MATGQAPRLTWAHTPLKTERDSSMGPCKGPPGVDSKRPRCLILSLHGHLPQPRTSDTAGLKLEPQPTLLGSHRRHAFLVFHIKTP
jgi:hypothetical protein